MNIADIKSLIEECTDWWSRIIEFARFRPAIRQLLDNLDCDVDTLFSARGMFANMPCYSFGYIVCVMAVL